MGDGLGAPGSGDPVAEAFKRCFKESLPDVLDVTRWQVGDDLGQLYDRLTAEVEDALRQDRDVRNQMRREVFPRIRTRPGAPPCAGVFRVGVDGIERTHRCLLFNGAVEACDGTQQTHETLPLTVFQIGVALVSYNGDQGTWSHRLFRRDLRSRPANPRDEVLSLLEAREQRDGLN